LNVPDWYEILLLSVAAWRVFQLLSADDILETPRRYVTSRLDEKWELFIECPYCAGFWIGVVWWVAWLIWPYETILISVPWAISAGVIGASKILSSEA
jgi:hypothetical protein